MSILSKPKLSKKIGDGVNLDFDLTVLKPAEYRAAAAEAEKEEMKKEAEVAK